MWELIVGYLLDSSKQKRDEQSRLEYENRRQIENFYNEVDDDTSVILQNAKDTEAGILNDPIKGLGLTYTEASGFSSIPIDLSTGMFNGSISLQFTTTSDQSRFTPEEFNSKYATIKILDACFTKWGIILAIIITNNQKNYNIPSNWCEESTLISSTIYLIDKENNEYYYPVSSTMKGEVVCGYPKIELIAFSPFRNKTNKFSVFMSNLPLQKTEGNRSNLVFEYTDDKLRSTIEDTLSESSMVDRISKLVNQEGEKLKSNNKESNGCSPLVAIFIILIIVILII